RRADSAGDRPAPRTDEQAGRQGLPGLGKAQTAETLHRTAGRGRPRQGERMTRSVPSHENPDLLARAVARGPNCPPVERLAEAVLGEIHSDERQALEAHAAGCPACGSEWALAHAFALAGVRAEAGGERVLASLSAKPAGGGRLLDFRSSPRRAARGSATSAWQRGAVAALLVAGLGLGYLTVRGGVPPDPGVPPGDDVVRATGFALGAPAGALAAAPSRREVEALAGATRCRSAPPGAGGTAP